MQDPGSTSEAPDAISPGSTALSPLLIAVGLALLWTGQSPAQAQPRDTIQVAGTPLVSGDSAEARRLLRADLGPTSRRWTRLQDTTKRFAAAKTLFKVARLAYPKRIWADSVLAFLRAAGTRHPTPEVRAEFLYGGLQVAESAGRDQIRREFYQRLTDDHEGSHFAQEAQRLFAPDSGIRPGQELPAFTLPRLSDSTLTVSKSDFDGQTLLIDFWGSWCPPCIRAMPHLHEAYRRHGGEDFTILSVAMRDTREAVRKFRTHRWEMPWHHAFIPKGSDLQRRLRSRFNISSFPMAILVGPEGKILSVNRGAGSGKKMAPAIREAVAEGDPGDSTSSGATGEGTSHF